MKRTKINKKEAGIGPLKKNLCLKILVGLGDTVSTIFDENGVSTAPKISQRVFVDYGQHGLCILKMLTSSKCDLPMCT